jgi:hypothetical protein
VSALKIGLLICAFVAVVGFLSGEMWVLLAIGFVAAAIAFLNARDWDIERHPFDLPASAPRVRSGDVESIDLGEELADLLHSVSYTAGRLLEDKGRVEPFVMYEDARGEVRTRRVDTNDPERVLGRAREIARAIDPTAPRVILAVPGTAEIDGRARKVVIYEAAEKHFRDRTLAFVQPYDPRLLIFPARVRGVPIYVGDAPHALRFATP